MTPPKPEREPRLVQGPVGGADSPSAQRFVVLVRDGLTHLHDPTYLQRHPLTRFVRSDSAPRSSSLGRALRQAILDTVEALRPSPDITRRSHAHRTYQILKLHYVDGLEIPQVQDRLALSKSVYYVERQRAVEAVALVLWESWGLGGASGEGEALRSRSAPTSERRVVGSAGGDRRAEVTLPRQGTPTNLPVQLTSFVGRKKEIAEVKRLLGAMRLLTLTGTGGCGKTRLAYQVAADVLDDYADGVWVAELAALADPHLIELTVAQALGLREVPGQPILSLLVNHLRSRRCLLILDNCEHLVEECARIAEELLRACPSLHLLATSRQLLGVPGEVAWRVLSLSIPGPEGLPSFEEIDGCESVRLFVERGKAAEARFILTESTAPAVAEICRRLDGIPLAIELAAARTSVLSPDQIASRLDHDFHLLTGGNRTALPRQQTLEATLDWSHSLLADRERILLRRLSVFSGGFRLEAAEAVCSGDGIAELAVLDLLIQLVDKSLVEVDTRQSDARYRLLEPVRQYAWHRLEEASEADSVSRRHADWCLAFVKPGESELVGSREMDWLRRVAPEQSNVRAALRWCLDHDPEAGLSLAARIWRYWQFHSRDAERKRIVDEMMSRAASPTVDRSYVLRMAGIDALDQGDYDRAAALLEESVSTCREIGYEVGTVWALGFIGRVALQRGDYRRARAAMEERVSLARKLGEGRAIASALHDLADLTWTEGDYPRTRTVLDESLNLWRAEGAQYSIAWVLVDLGALSCSEGDYARARLSIEEGLDILREIPDPPGIGRALGDLGYVALLESNYPRARECLTEALRALQPFGHRPRMSRCLAFLGVLAARDGDAARAARLVGAAEAVNGHYRHMLAPNERADLDACLTAARAALGEEAYARTRAEGRAMSVTKAVEYALGPDHRA